MPDDRPLTFNLEVHCEPTSREMSELAHFIIADKESTIREKLLAKIALHQMYLFNKLVESLEYGTVTVRVNPKDVKPAS